VYALAKRHSSNQLKDDIIILKCSGAQAIKFSHYEIVLIKKKIEEMSFMMSERGVG
jgi:hypothetical protein